MVDVIQLLNRVRLFATLRTAACQVSLPFTTSRSLLNFTSIEAAMPSNHLILCHPLLFCPQSFPASGSFSMSWLFPLGDQSIGASASAPVLPMNIEGWFPLGPTGLISLLSKGLSTVFFSTTFKRINYLALSLFITLINFNYFQLLSEFPLYGFLIPFSIEPFTSVFLSDNYPIEISQA